MRMRKRETPKQTIKRLRKQISKLKFLVKAQQLKTESWQDMLRLVEELYENLSLKYNMQNRPLGKKLRDWIKSKSHRSRDTQTTIRI